MNHCATCGTALPNGAQFCPKCGADLRLPAAFAESAAQPATTPTVQSAPVLSPAKPARHVTMPPREYTPATERAAMPPAEQKSHWWIVPLVIIGVVVLAFLLLMGLPFGGRDEGPAARTASAETETIAEGAAPSAPAAGPESTGTLIDVGETPEPQPSAATATVTTTVAPAPAPATTTMAPPPATRTEQPARTTTPPARTTTPPVRTQPPARTERPAATAPPPMTSAAPAPSRSGEISEDEAVSTLRGFLVTRNYYETGAGCLTVSSEGYSNVGYTLSVTDRCGSRQLGRWRVDSKTREVFRQREDGRFLRP